MRLPVDIPQQAVDMLAAKVGPGTTATGVVSAVVSAGYSYIEQAPAAEPGMTLSEWGIVASIFGIVAGVAIQLYFGWGRSEREREYHNARMRWIKDQGGPPADPEAAE